MCVLNPDASFTAAWGEYLLALSLITSNDKWTLPLALQGAISQNTIDLGALTAGGVMISLPVAVLFMSCNAPSSPASRRGVSKAKKLKL